MVQFKKGDAFPLPKQANEGVLFSIEQYTMLLVYYFKKPTEKERETFKSGDAKLAVTSMRNTLFVLSKFGELPWMDTPYSTHLSPAPKSFPELSEGQGYAIDAFLVDVDSNVLKEHRLLHLDTPSSLGLKKLVYEEQARVDFSIETYDRTVAEIYAGYSVKQLLGMKVFETKLKG